MLSRIAFWCLLPIAAVQGLSLRKKALRLPPPSGLNSGLLGQRTENRFSKPIKVLALGDSIIAGIGASSQEQSLSAQFASALARSTRQAVSWKALGTSGDDSSDLLIRLDNLENEPPPDLVLISIGVNDVTGLRSGRTWRANLVVLFSKLGARWPEALILFAGLPPMGKFPLPPQPMRFCMGLRAAYFDRIAESLIDKHAGMLHIPTVIDTDEYDFCPDGFHPSDSAYVYWGEEMAAIILDHYPNLRRSKAS